MDWRRQSLTNETVRDILRNTRPDIFGIAGVTNARTARDVAGLEVLSRGPVPNTVGELREVLDQDVRPSVEPEEVWTLAEDLGYSAEIRPSANPTDGTFDVLFRGKGAVKSVVPFPSEEHAMRPSGAYATNPLRSRVLRNLVPDLRRWLTSSA
jgi:hypothetical protein